MLRIRRTAFFLLFLAIVSLSSGCDFGDKAKTLKEDIINITLEQVAWQLENSLNSEFPGVQVNSPQILYSNGEINWEQLRQSELGNFIFYNVGSFQFRAILTGDGVFKIERINYSTGDTYSYAEFDVQRIDGKFKVTAR